jgi:hypothetical protein
MKSDHFATVAILDALLTLIERGDVDAAADYARRRMSDLAAAADDEDGAPTLPPGPPTDVQDLASAMRRAKTAARTRRWRDKRALSNGVHASSPCLGDTEQSVQCPANAASPGVTVTRHQASPSVTCDVTERHAERHSRARVDSSSLSISRSSKLIGRGDARAGASVTGDASVTLNKSPAERESPPPGGLKSIETGERPPPSSVSAHELLTWCIDRGLDPHHPRIGRFLDVRRQAKLVHDWPAAWRVFLEDEASGRFSGPRVKNAPAPPADDPQTRVRERERLRAADAAHEQLRAAVAPPPPDLLAALGGKGRGK